MHTGKLVLEAMLHPTKYGLHQLAMPMAVSQVAATISAVTGRCILLDGQEHLQHVCHKAPPGCAGHSTGHGHLQGLIFARWLQQRRNNLCRLLSGLEVEAFNGLIGVPT